MIVNLRLILPPALVLQAQTWRREMMTLFCTRFHVLVRLYENDSTQRGLGFGLTMCSAQRVAGLFAIITTFIVALWSLVLCYCF